MEPLAVPTQQVLHPRLYTTQTCGTWMEERKRSDDQKVKCYSDDQWWDSQDYDHHLEELLLHHYQIAPNPGLDHDRAGRGAELLTSAPQYHQTANGLYPVSGTSVSPDNPTKRTTQVTSPARPKRRRGRGGTMAATTFLSSTITNFRELVQQHTGLSTTPPSSSSYYASCDRKGPITLCFANYSSSSTTSESALGFNTRNQ